jgi:serine/threonine-protein kinase
VNPELSSSSTDDAVVVAFYQLYRADVAARGAPLEMACYEQRFVGYEALIAREYASLQQQASAAAASVVLATHDSDALARALGTARRYQRLAEIGRGGMGVVVRVRDERLRRDLAMKVLGAARGTTTAPGTHTQSLGRFLDEALITGQLGHPGIVPVHDLGLDDDGRVFFTMALIEGRNFAAIIDTVHRRDDPQWTLARALGVLVRVCEAIAFAHSRGVIHRDLKPANIMVGAFGETYVLDWGLARVRGAAHAPELSGPQGQIPGAPAVDSPNRTMAGDVLGTPAYMAPEQARGDVSELGECTDVYALGAVLYHLLTGIMPYGARTGSAPSSREVLERVRERAPAPLTSVQTGVAPELIAICNKAMQRDSRARYGSAAMLGGDLRAFLELRVVQAYRTGAVAELRQWVRRNRALAATALAAVLALVAGLAFSLQQMRRAQTQSVAAAANYGLARDAVDRMLSRVGMHGLARVPQMEAVRRDLLQQALVMHRELLARRRGDLGAETSVARALLDVATIERQLGNYKEAQQALEESLQSYAPRRLGAGQDLALLRDLVDVHTELSVVLIRQGDLERSAQECEAGLAYAAQVLATEPANKRLLSRKGTLLNNLATTKTHKGEWAQALPIRRDAEALAQELLARHPEDNDVVRFAMTAAENLGLTLANLDQLEAAQEALTIALRRFTASSPAQQADPERRLVSANVLSCLSWVQFRQDRVAQALASLQSAITELRRLVADYPQTQAYRSQLATTLNNIANVYGKLGDTAAELAALAEAEREHVAALRIAPDNADSAQFLPQTRRTLCRALVGAGRHREAARQVVDFAASDLVPAPPVEVARVLLLCAAAADTDAARDATERQRVAEEYRCDAVRALQQAAKTDPKVLDGAEFAALAARPDFSALLRAVQR